MSFSWLFHQKCAVSSLLRPSWKQKRWSLLLAYRWRCLPRRQGGWKGDRLPPASSCGLQGDALHIAKLCLTDVAHALLTSRLTELSNTSAHTAHSSQLVAGAGHGWPASRKEWGLSYSIYQNWLWLTLSYISVVFRHRQLILLQVWHWLSLQKDCRGLSEGEPVWFSLVRQLGTFIAKWRMACFSNFSFDYRIVFEILWKREVFCWETMCVRHRPASSSAMWRRLQQMQNVWRSCKETKEHLFYFASGKAQALEASRCYLSVSQMLVDSSRWCNRGCCPFFAVVFAGCVAKTVSSECLRLWQSFKRSKILRNLTCASCLLLWSSLSKEYTAWIDSKKVSVI